MRARDRGGVDANGNDTKKTTNLDHGSVFVNLGFNSGYIGDVVGTDIVIYSTFDMWQNGGPDHEMNFWGVNNPYEKKHRVTVIVVVLGLLIVLTMAYLSLRQMLNLNLVIM